MKIFKSKFFGCMCFCVFLASSFLILASNVSAELTEAQIQEQERVWRAELEKTEKEIAEWENVLKTTKQGTASLQRDAQILQAKINEAKAFIKQRQIQIEQLTRDIGLKNKTISELEEKINRGKESLASILRQTNSIDEYSLVEVMLSNKNLSHFFEDVDAYSTINKSLEEQFIEIRELQGKTEGEKKILADKRNAEADKKAEIESQKKKVEVDEKEKQRLININKTQEKTYEQVIKEKQAQAAKIRAALFALRDTEGIPFGDALKYAQIAGQRTGVRPALILAILTQESDLGKNQGSCLVNNLETGDGAGKNTGTLFERVMYAKFPDSTSKRPSDTIPFKSITERLSKDWRMTPVSCPPGKIYTPGRGFGGGMGPSQFIPSTWELYKNNIGSSLGIDGDSVNPWNPEHAILATAIYMAELGAAKGSYTAEKNSACLYYSGDICKPDAQRKKEGKPRNMFYGLDVMAKAENIQLTMI